MDFVTMAAGIVALLVPYVKKAGENFAGEAGKAVFQKVGSLFTRLKQHFGGDEAARDTLNRFEQNPNRYQPFLEDVLKEKLEKDLALREEMARFLADIKEIGPEVTVVQKMKKAEGVIGLEAGQVSGGSVEVDQDIDEAKNVTGAKIDSIGR